MTGLPPPNKKKTAKVREAARKKRNKEAKVVQDEIVTAEELIAEDIDNVVPPREELPERPNVVYATLWKGEGLPAYSNDLYDLKYVECLHDGIMRHTKTARLHLILDDHYWKKACEHPALLGVTKSKFEGHGCGGWSNIMEVFSPANRPKGNTRHVWMGLDTVLVGNCDWLFQWNTSPMGLPIDPINPARACNAVMSYNEEGADIAWEAYEVAKAKNGMNDFRLQGQPSEMQLLRFLCKRERWRPLEIKPKQLLSYKSHVTKGAPWRGASVVYFHGVPKPHELPLQDPIRKEWLGAKPIRN